MTIGGTLDKIVSLAKRRGFIFPGSEIYGGFANSWDYGPLGVELKNNVKRLWWERYVHRRPDIVGIDSALIMNPKVWEASGHLKTFNDPLIECKSCHHRFRADQIPGLECEAGVCRIVSEISCPGCGLAGEKAFGEARTKQFNLMFKTFVGPAEESASVAYFRPETAQGMFVGFKNVLDSTRVTLPFGIAQVGKAFRNEITAGNFLFRVREFEQMEIEYFIRPPQSDVDWQRHFDDWQKEMMSWTEDIGIDMGKIHAVDIAKGELAHYSRKTIDFEFEFPFGQKELYGLAYRTDFDLKNHMEKSGEDLRYTDPDTGEKFIPHVIEPTWGVDRTVLAILLSAYHEDKNRTLLRLKPELAPYKAAVFPLLANRPELVEKAKSIYDELRQHFPVAWDDRGNIGKRYYSQDEIGTPFCVTVDFDTLKKSDATVRVRDTAKQERVPIEKLKVYIAAKAGG